MKKSVLIFGIAAMLFVGCKNDEKKGSPAEENVETVDAYPPDGNKMEAIGDTSENSLDWAGVYEGTTPCADCEGIKTVLELKNDKTYILSQTYLGKPAGENEFTQTGNFVWDRAGKMIRLKTESGAFQYDVGENKLWMLDVKRNRIEGDLADMYILKKQIQ
jgi:uncharacterized lipoprotein NlpE involved in copper resistance